GAEDPGQEERSEEHHRRLAEAARDGEERDRAVERRPSLPQAQHRERERDGQAPFDRVDERQLAVEPEERVRRVERRGEDPGGEPPAREPRGERDDQRGAEPRGQDRQRDHAVERPDARELQELEQPDVERIAGRMRMMRREVEALDAERELHGIVIPHPPRRERQAEQHCREPGEQGGDRKEAFGRQRGEAQGGEDRTPTPQVASSAFRKPWKLSGATSAPKRMRPKSVANGIRPPTNASRSAEAMRISIPSVPPAVISAGRRERSRVQAPLFGPPTTKRSGRARSAGTSPRAGRRGGRICSNRARGEISLAAGFFFSSPVSKPSARKAVRG